MIIDIRTPEDLSALLSEEDALLIYFSTASCNVCKVLKPQVETLITDSFPNMKMVFVDSEQFPELAASFRVFVAPTVLVFLAGKEYLRKSRAFGLNELKNEILRPYSLMFG